VALLGHGSGPGGGELPPSADREAAAAATAEAAEQDGTPLGFSCNVLVLGLRGAGRTTLINEMVGYRLAPGEAASAGRADAGDTPSCSGRGREAPLEWLHGEVRGVQMHFLDVPGLSPAAQDSRRNLRVLSRVRAALADRPPDIVLFVDRLDAGQVRATGRVAGQICRVLGRGVWARSVVVLTHASSLPFDEESGEASEFDAVCGWRAHSTLYVLRHAVLSPDLHCPFQFVELHHNSEKGPGGEKLLVDGTPWRPSLLMHCFLAKVLRQFSEEAAALGSALSEAGGSDGGESLRSSWSSHGGFLRAPQDRRRLLQALGFMPLGHLAAWILRPCRPLTASEATGAPWELRCLKEGEVGEASADFPWVAAHPAFPFSLSQGLPRPDFVIPAPDPSMLPRFDCDSGARSHRYRYQENLSNPWVCRAIVDTDWYEGEDGVNGFTSEGQLDLGWAEHSVPAHVTAHVTMPGRELEAADCHMEFTLRRGDAGGLCVLGDIEAQQFGQQGAVASARLEAHAPMTPRSRLVVGASTHRCGPLARPLGEGALGLRLGQILELPREQEAEVALAVVQPQSRAGAMGGGDAGGGAIQGVSARYWAAVRPEDPYGLTCRASCSALRHGGRSHVIGDVHLSGRLPSGATAAVAVQKAPHGPTGVTVKLSSQEDLRPGLAGAALMATAWLGRGLHALLPLRPAATPTR